MSLTAIVQSILRFFASATGSYALAIIMLTVIVRVLLFPLTVRSSRMMEQMKKIQPEQKKLQEKYKDDPQEFQRRLMDLYREHKINPFSGCLPSLLPIPIFVVLYRVFTSAAFIESIQQMGVSVSFLWISNLANVDPVVLPLLSGATTFFSMWQTAGDQEQQKFTALLMGLMLGWWTRSLASAAALYWIVNNILGIAQQYLVGRSLRAVKEEAQSS